MRWFLTICSLLVLAVALYSGFVGKTGVLTFGFLSFSALLFFANLGQISEFKASSTGIEAKTRNVIKRAENTISELKILAKTVAATSLSLVKRNGRMGGYSVEEEESIKKSVFETLSAIGVPENEFEAVLGDWHTFTEFDYAHCILGATKVPKGADQAVITEWKSLRNGIVDIPSPETIETFLSKINCLDAERIEFLEDYRHYVKTRTHRRPEVWSEHENWPNLEIQT